ncbi:hypothetical protein QBC47DRAFT_114015 [Echria macrotheca]|uniref:Uncharacterized protein n=1 Tax=Echria macrotheca TaxID=438768 RepID=A0AAJ0BK03_9PEZI|nr:hypothetical protein QBC47DRAFT_114015 [Echria macrotheca]
MTSALLVAPEVLSTGDCRDMLRSTDTGGLNPAGRGTIQVCSLSGRLKEKVCPDERRDVGIRIPADNVLEKKRASPDWRVSTGPSASRHSWLPGALCIEPLPTRSTPRYCILYSLARQLLSRDTRCRVRRETRLSHYGGVRDTHFGTHFRRALQKLAVRFSLVTITRSVLRRDAHSTVIFRIDTTGNRSQIDFWSTCNKKTGVAPTHTTRHQKWGHGWIGWMDGHVISRRVGFAIPRLTRPRHFHFLILPLLAIL